MVSFKIQKKKKKETKIVITEVPLFNRDWSCSNSSSITIHFEKLHKKKCLLFASRISDFRKKILEKCLTFSNEWVLQSLSKFRGNI